MLDRDQEIRNIIAARAKELRANEQFRELSAWKRRTAVQAFIRNQFYVLNTGADRRYL